MAVVFVVQVPAHQVVEMVSVWSLLMSAVGAVSVFAAVALAVVLWGAGVRVGVAYRDDVFIDVIAVDVVQVTIMKIVGMPVVAYSHMPAARSVRVTVCGMRLTVCFLHASSFLSGNA